MIRHRNFGFTVLCLSVILSFFRFIALDKAKIVQLLLGVVMVVAMTFGADLGGLMVYKYGVAVKAAPQPAVHDHSMHGHENSEMMPMEEDDFSGIIMEEETKKQGEHDHSSHEH